MNKKRVFISIPMNNRSSEEIEGKFNRVKRRLETIGFSVEESYKKEYNKDDTSPLYALAESLIHMSHCDVAIFCKGWNKARGCIVENMVANLYGLKVIYERDI